MTMKESDNTSDLETNGMPYPAQKPDSANKAGKKMFRQSAGNTYDPNPFGYATKRIDEKELDDYLDNEFNLEIFLDLSEGDNKDVFDNPLQFFRLFDEQIEFVGENISKPITVIETLKQLPITENQRHILFYYLNELVGRVDNGAPNGQMLICKKLIEKEFNKLDEKLFPERKSQAATPEQLKSSETNLSHSADNERTPPKEREEMNIERAFLFFEYLLTFVNATANKTKKNQAIERLTGYKFAQLTKLPSWFEKEKLENEEKTAINEKFMKDMEEVRKLFISLGLNEIAGLVEKDLGD